MSLFETRDALLFSLHDYEWISNMNNLLVVFLLLGRLCFFLLRMPILIDLYKLGVAFLSRSCAKYVRVTGIHW